MFAYILMFLVFHSPENISSFSLGISFVMKADGCNSAKAPAHSTTARLEAKHTHTEMPFKLSITAIQEDYLFCFK